MAKRILVVTQHFWPENFRINDIVEGFLQDGLEVDVLCGLPNYPKGEWFDGYGPQGPWEEHYGSAQVFRAKEWPRKGNTSLNIFLNYVSWPLYAAAALDRLPGGYDAVFCFNTSPVLMCWPAIRYARKHKIPFTNYVLDLWPENLYSVLPVSNKLLRRIAQGVSDHLYKQADRLIAMSEPLQQRLCERTGKPKSAVAAIPQYCEDFYAVPQHDAALEERFAGRFNLVFTGTFTPAQSLDMVLRAVLEARAAGAENLHLLLVGDGMSRESLQTLAQELHAEDAVTFYGSVPAKEVPKFTALADALLISLSDSPDLGLTVPGKLASYMAAGKPILASMNGAGFAAVQQSGGGLVSPACDQHALAENMLRLTTMTETDRAALGAKAKEYYLAHYRRAELLRRLETFILQGE
ncbi:MAG TPA: glycosyltransferase family 4 protein [Candidatus Gemmiger excrementigallinarum]|uniref:Glycosyltransferase family 4 protein n=1 Tax=Candidatus Gemmiger excrementigallinarum TaxID=2838609 RepID=A0A9D2ERZ0_9FIRM|nr:glycosyltransferase family 4 protein [Candidatus Gemmiger excrementigallinarum]